MLKMTLVQAGGVYAINLTPDDEGPVLEIECTGELSQKSLAWNIHRMASNVEYVDKPRELDPQKVIARLEGRLPPNADVSKTDGETRRAPASRPLPTPQHLPATPQQDPVQHSLRLSRVRQPAAASGGLVPERQDGGVRAGAGGVRIQRRPPT